MALDTVLSAENSFLRYLAASLVMASLSEPALSPGFEMASSPIHDAVHSESSRAMDQLPGSLHCVSPWFVDSFTRHQ